MLDADKLSFSVKEDFNIEFYLCMEENWICFFFESKFFLQYL